LADFEQFETKRLDLREYAEQRGAILEPTGEHGLAILEVGRHRGKRGQGGGSEPAPYPDQVKAREPRHMSILRPDRVSRRRRDPMIV
jgi:hypothetical protein